MAEEKNKGGRPPLTKEDKLNMLRKLEPYLKSGLSARKSLLEAKVPSTTFYETMAEDEWFREQIEQYRNFTAILINNALTKEVHSIIEKQNGNATKKIKPQKLSKDDRNFLQWFALNSNLTKHEYGERKDINLFDPEAEINKVKGIVAEETTKEIEGLE